MKPLLGLLILLALGLTVAAQPFEQKVMDRWQAGFIGNGNI